MKERNLSDGGRYPYALWKADGGAIRSTGILAMPQTRRTVELGTAVIKGSVCSNCGGAPVIRRDGREFIFFRAMRSLRGQAADHLQCA